MDIAEVPVAHVDDELYNVRLRLLRLWGIPTARGDSFQHVNLLFVDSEGAQLEAILRRPHVAPFLPHLVEGRIYRFMRFDIEEHPGLYRVADTNIRMIFRGDTTLDILPESEDIPNVSFRFLEPMHFPAAYANPILLPDLVGTVMRCKPSEFLHPGLPLRRKVVYLQAVEGPVMTITLWDSAVNLLEAMVSNAEALGKVMVVTSCFIEQVNGAFVFPTSRATKIFLNLHCPQLHPLLNEELHNIPAPVYVDPYIEHEEAVATAPFRKALDLTQVQQDINMMDKKFRAKVRITNYFTAYSSGINLHYIHLSGEDETGAMEVVFPSTHLRAVLHDVLPLAEDEDFQTLFNSMAGNSYEILVQMSPWNFRNNQCDILLVKFFPEFD